MRATTDRCSLSRRALVTIAGLVLAFITAQAQQAEAPAPTVVHITAERFEFRPAEVTVTAGAVIEFHLTSEDTAHGFRVVGHAVETAIPKRGRGDAQVRFTPPAAGSYVFECSRMCGAGHSFMRGVIKVKPAGGER